MNQHMYVTKAAYPFDNAILQHHFTALFDNAVWQRRLTMSFDNIV